jgi:hypothetical protein
MNKLRTDFVDRVVQVSFTTGAVTGVLEFVEEDGSLLIRQGRMPVWIPLSQVRYVTLMEERPPADEIKEPLT